MDRTVITTIPAASAEEQLGCLYFLATVNRAAVNKADQASMGPDVRPYDVGYMLDIYPYICVLSFMRTLHCDWLNACPFTFRPTLNGVPSFPTTSPASDVTRNLLCG